MKSKTQKVEKLTPAKRELFHSLDNSVSSGFVACRALANVRGDLKPEEISTLQTQAALLVSFSEEISESLGNGDADAFVTVDAESMKLVNKECNKGVRTRGEIVRAALSNYLAANGGAK